MRKHKVSKIAFWVVFFVIWVQSLFAQQVDTAWVRRYNGPGNFADYGWAIAVDASRNVYVTGRSHQNTTPNGGDYATIKYYPNGDTAWERRYNGTGNSDDFPVAIAVDKSSNVIVTGRSKNPGDNSDYATIKYYPNGDIAWARIYNGPEGTNDYAEALAVDDDDYVYITGVSSGIGTHYDFATIKYNPSGDAVWVRRYNSPENIYDWATAIAVDGSGNVYVTGFSYFTGTDANIVTVKYYSNGDIAWTAKYNGPGNGDDRAYGIALDANRNVFVTGYATSAAGDSDYVTIKYDQNGNELWAKRYNGTGNSNDCARSVAVDASGNIYVTGDSRGSSTYRDYATIKYYPNGDTAWARRYDGPGNQDDMAYSIAVDGSGNVYVTGDSWNVSTRADCTTVKYSSNGNVEWIKRYDGPAHSDDSGHDIALDSSGGVYVIGQSTGIGTNADYLTIKYSPLLVGYWKFDEGTGTIAHDFSGYGNDGTLMNGPTWVNGLPPLGKALELDGINDYVDCGNDLSLNVTGDITISAWVKFDSLPDDHLSSFVSKDEGPGSYYKWIFAHSRNVGGITSALTLHINNPYGVEIWLSSLDWIPSLGRWYHVAVVGNTGNYKFYVDGTDWGEDNTAYTLPSISAHVEIGRAEEWNYHNGVLDEVKIYGRALTAEEIMEEYKRGLVNEYSLVPVDLKMGLGDSTVQVNINIKTVDTVGAFVVCLFAEGTSNPVLDTLLTGGPSDPNPPAFAPPSLVSTFGIRVVNPYGLPDNPLVFVAIEPQDNEALIPPANGLYCRMFYKVNSPGTLTFRTAVHSMGGPTCMVKPFSYVLAPINWNPAEEVGSFNVTEVIRGDANGDGQITVSDVIYLINYLFKGGPSPDPLAVGDVNCDGKVSVSDVVYLINYLFKGGPPLC